VVLGKMAELFEASYMEKPPDGFNSCKAIGKYSPDFSNSLVLPNGVTIPLGKPVENQKGNEYRFIQHNEYIVYDTSQVRMRYLVELKA